MKIKLKIVLQFILVFILCFTIFQIGKGKIMEDNRNPYYEMFYGEWQMTENIYVNPSPVRGIYYSSVEINERIKEILKKKNLIKNVKFTSEEVIMDKTKKIKDIYYENIIFSENRDYEIIQGQGTTLKDIGLDEGKYYVFVRLKSEEYSFLQGQGFFIKDKNTLIMHTGYGCYIEYKRISYDGGSEVPVLIEG